MRLLEADSDLRPWLGRKHIPALCLAARHAKRLRLGVIRVNLHRKFFPREQQLDEEGKALVLGIAERLRHASRHFGKARAAQLTGCYLAVFSRQPDLANTLAVFGTCVPGRKVVRTPDSLYEHGLEHEGRRRWTGSEAGGGAVVGSHCCLECIRSLPPDVMTSYAPPTLQDGP